MNRIAFLIASFFLFSITSHAFSLRKNDLKFENLKGPVKTVKVYDVKKSVYFDADTVAKYERLNLPLPEFQRVLDRATEYDERGMITSDKYKYAGLTLNSYDPQNKNTLLFTRQVEYDDEGRLRRIYTLDLDNNGFPLTGLAIDANGDTIFTETFETLALPDDKILITNSHISYTIFPSNTNKLIVGPDLSIENLKYEKPNNYSIFELNDNELPIRCSTYNYDDELMELVEIEYLPDEINTYLIKKNGERYLANKASLDDKGNIIYSIRYDEDGNIDSTESTYYEYDAYGNWIKKATSKNSDKEGKTTEREITYYEE